jgi:hypothetical protein
MCFVVEYTHPESFIAKEDITCYKVVNYREEKIVSEYKKFVYDIDKLYKLDEPLKEINGQIEKGFHSYTKLRIAVGDKTDYQIVIKCIIPKGSVYFISDYYEEYVADAIIIKEILVNKTEEE